MAHRPTPLLLMAPLLAILLSAPAPTSAVEPSPASADQLALINITFDTDAIYLFEGEEIEVNFTVLYYYGVETATITFESESDFNFEIVNASDVGFVLTSADDYPKTMTFNLRGKHISISEMSVLMTVDGYIFHIDTVVVKTNLIPNPIYTIVNYLMLAVIIVSFITMGTTIDLKLIWERLRRPWAVLIGMLCQFFIMPALAFGLAKALRLDNASAIGLVLDGSCPGDYKWPKMQEKAMKLLKPVSTIVLAITLATSLPFQLYIFAAPWNVYLAAFLLPLCGAVCGSLIAKITCIKPNAAIVTISLETGVQNALMANSIIILFYPHPEAELAARVPFLIFLMTLFEGIIIAAIYLPYKRFCKKPDDEVDDEEKKIKDEKMKEVYSPEEMKEKKKGDGETVTVTDGVYTNPAFDKN